ncbi:hypothetical protein [Chroococcidiopsis sp. SAG 2025]|uniref:hypothetical protein n=1 Tax=Chroococcidiopsis sp. SAG 2025 TaxID=171389 RepID=UPI002937139A|nr:hypothetical protein [Chroococcidiopsis sp. SAG 2025]
MQNYCKIYVPLQLFGLNQGILSVSVVTAAVSTTSPLEPTTHPVASTSGAGLTLLEDSAGIGKRRGEFSERLTDEATDLDFIPARTGVEIAFDF